MAAIENLEIIVDVDIASAIAALEELEQELVQLGADIQSLDAMGTEGIDIRADLDGIDGELAALKARLEAFEAANELNIDTDLDNTHLFQTMPGRGSRNWFQSFASPDELGEGMGWLFGDRRRNSLFRNLRRQIGDLADRFDDFDLRMSDLHNAVARLVPLLLVFLGVLPAAITALVGLAAAAIGAAASLGAIAGLGALGVGLQGGQFDMRRLTDIWEEIRDDFIEAFAPLAERLEPLFMNAIDGLEMFFNAVAGQGDALMELTDEARDFGGFIIDFVPTMLRAFAGMVEALAPVFSGIGGFLEREFTKIMRDLTVLTQQAIPALAEFILRIGRAIPAITQFSIGLTMVANALLATFGVMADLLGLLGVTSRTFGVLIGVLLTTFSALALVNVAMGTFVAQTLSSAILAVYGFYEALFQANSQLAFLASTSIYRSIVGLKALIASVIMGQTSFWGLATSIFSATGALAAFMTIATLGAAAALVGVAISAASSFLGLAGSIDSATSSLREFNRVSGRTGGGGFNPYGQGTRGAGAADAPALGPSGGAGGGVVVNVEGGRDRDDDRSNARYAGWRMGRTTGGDN